VDRGKIKPPKKGKEKKKREKKKGIKAFANTEQQEKKLNLCHYCTSVNDGFIPISHDAAREKRKKKKRIRAFARTEQH